MFRTGYADRDSAAFFDVAHRLSLRSDVDLDARRFTAAYAAPRDRHNIGHTILIIRSYQEHYLRISHRPRAK